MAVDQAKLFAAAFPEHRPHAARLSGLRFGQALRAGGSLLLELHGPDGFRPVPGEPDMVRAWRAFAVTASGLSLVEALAAVRPFALDDHFAVREWAWLSLRDAIAVNPLAAVDALAPVMPHAPVRWQRFAVEATRPRSVWGRHLPAFKQQPSSAEPVLRPALTTKDPYLWTSLVNWLNDVSVTHPEWVGAIVRERAAAQPEDEVRFESAALRRYWRGLGPH